MSAAEEQAAMSDAVEQGTDEQGKAVVGRLNCAQGVNCIIEQAKYDAKLQAWLRAGQTGKKPTRPSRGHHFKAASAVKYHADGWLPCNHFCCDFLSEAAVKYCEARNKPKQTCAEAHRAWNCTTRGDKDLAVYRAAIENDSTTKKERPNASQKAKAKNEVSNHPALPQ